MITWTERCELYFGARTIVLVAQAHGRTLTSRYYPRLPDAQEMKARIINAFTLYLDPRPDQLDIVTGAAGYECLAPGVEWMLTLDSPSFSTLAPRPEDEDRAIQWEFERTYVKKQSP